MRGGRGRAYTDAVLAPGAAGPAWSSVRRARRGVLEEGVESSAYGAGQEKTDGARTSAQLAAYIQSRHFTLQRRARYPTK